MKRKVLQGFQALFALFLAYFAILLLHYHYYLITFPYPATYREGVSMATTTMLLHGVKPYNFLMEPQYTNIYGIVYPLVSLPFVRLFGEGIVVYRAITALFIFASCFVIFLVLQKKKTPLLLNFWAVLALYASLLFPLTTTPCVDPGATGLFFMLLTIFIPFLLNFSWISLTISILCGLTAFYTKLYFCLGLPVMASYLFFFISKKRSIVFGGWCLLSFTLSIVFMNYFFPSYFDDCFFMHVNYISKYSLMIVLVTQLQQFLDLNKGMLILILGVLAYSLWQLFFTDRIKDLGRVLKGLGASIHWDLWEAPLSSNRLAIDTYAGICFTMILITLMGKQYGANLWYFFQLFSPFLVIITVGIIGRFALWPVVFSVLLIYNLFSLSYDDDYKYFAKDAIGVLGWQEIQMLIRSKDCIFGSPLIAPLLIKNNMEVFDDGHTECFYGGGQRRGLLGYFLKEDKNVNRSLDQFTTRIRNMLKRKSFDYIIIEVSYPFKCIPNTVSNYYKYIDSILINLPQDRMRYLLTIWRPN